MQQIEATDGSSVHRWSEEQMLLILGLSACQRAAS